MESPGSIIYVPLSYLLAGMGLLLLLWLLCLRAIKGFVSNESVSYAAEEKDWTIPAIDSHAGTDSIFHRWDPRIKVASLLTFVFCVASLTRLPTAGAAVLIALGAVGLSRIPWRHPLRRLAAMGGFLGMFLVVMPLTVPEKSGDTVVVFSHLSFLSFNLRGFRLAVLVCLKASAIALMMEPLMGTSPFPTTMHALERLGLPRKICEMILLTHRYIYVFHHEMRRMATGMRARGFRKRTGMETVRTLGNFVGMLLVHSFERTQRVYEAMLSRGYNGTIPGCVTFQAHGIDWAKGAFWTLAGIGMLGADRLWPLLFGS